MPTITPIILNLFLHVSHLSNFTADKISPANLPFNPKFMKHFSSSVMHFSPSSICWSCTSHQHQLYLLMHFSSIQIIDALLINTKTLWSTSHHRPDQPKFPLLSLTLTSSRQCKQNRIVAPYASYTAHDDTSHLPTLHHIFSAVLLL